MRHLISLTFPPPPPPALTLTSTTDPVTGLGSINFDSFAKIFAVSSPYAVSNDDQYARTRVPPGGGIINTIQSYMTTPNIVLIGTSFSRNGQFDRALEAAFRQPVLNVARDGGGFAEAARRYFASPAYRDTKPRQIIWEIPERVLPQPISPDEASFLQSTD